MPTTKRKVNPKIHLRFTIVIYLFLIAAVSTYFIPFLSVHIPVMGQKSWSVSDIVKTIPEGFGAQGKRQNKLETPSFDFMDFVKEIAPRSKEGKAPEVRWSHLVLGILIPVALVVAYLSLLVGLLIAPLKRSRPLVTTSIVATTCAAYVLLAIFYFGAVTRQAVSEALSKTQESPFSFVTKHFVQEVSIAPDTGLIALIALCVLVFVTGILRWSRTGA